MSDILETKIKCPKCKNKKDFDLVEVYSGHTITWEVLDGKFDKNDGNKEMGDPSHMEATCGDCGHRWRIRGALQVTDVTKD